jgi:hypothetical protein
MMTPSAARVEWYLSGVDGDGHAFPRQQFTEEVPTQYEALCGHTLLANELDRTRPVKFHLDCLIRVGELSPHDTRWKTD